MKVDLLPWQSKVYKDDHRFRIVCAGRRAGKSVLSRLIVLDWATKQQGLYWIVSPTYKQAKMIHWRDMQKEIPREWIVKKNEVELSFTLKNNSIVELKGAENPDALRGVKLRGLVIDEIASIRNWDWLWSEVLRPTLTDYEAPSIFISTPKGYNHFYELYEIGQKADKLYKSWRFTSYENNKIPKGEIDAAKKELTEDTFAQEYLADFRKYTGLVYKGFDREVHVIEPFDIPEEWQIYRGWDYGDTNPTAWLWIGVDGDDNWFIVDEHYGKQQTSTYWAGILNAHPLSGRVVQSYGDPSAAGIIREYGENGRIFITPANKETGTSLQKWVSYGIEKVAEKLKRIPGHIVNSVKKQGTDSKPSLFVFNNCVETIREFETYRWKEKSVTQAQDLNEPDMPEKANDHAMDALRYFAVSYQKQTSNTPPPDQARFDNWGWSDKREKKSKSFRIGL